MSFQVGDTLRHLAKVVAEDFLLYRDPVRRPDPPSTVSSRPIPTPTHVTLLSPIHTRRERALRCRPIGSESQFQRHQHCPRAGRNEERRSPPSRYARPCPRSDLSGRHHLPEFLFTRHYTRSIWHSGIYGTRKTWTERESSGNQWGCFEGNASCAGHIDRPGHSQRTTAACPY